MNKIKTQKDEFLASASEILKIVSHPNRYKIFDYIASEKRTFEDLINYTKMSKSGLSHILSLLSSHGLIVSEPFDERVTHDLTEFGDFVYSYLGFCKDVISSFPVSETNILVLSADDLIKLIEKYDFETFMYLFEGRKIILSSLSFQQIVEWLDDKILDGEDQSKFEKFEDIVYGEDLFEVLEDYSEVEKGVRVEFYLRKQKKLSPKQAELVATAVDQKAVILSADENILLVGRKLGVPTIRLSKLVDFLKTQKLKVIGRAVIKPKERIEYFKTPSKQESVLTRTRIRGCPRRYTIAHVIQGGT